MFGVGAKPFGECDRADPREGEVEGGADDRECENDGAAVTSREGGKGGGGGELDQGGQTEEGAEGGWAAPAWGSRPARATGIGPTSCRKPHQTRQDEQPDRVEVGAPRRLHDHQGRPEVPDQDGGGWAARPDGDALQQEPTPKVEAEPDDFRRRDRTACQRHHGEEELAQRRIDGRDPGVVDLSVPGRSDGRQGLVFGRVGVGVHALQEHMAVPQVAKDVVGQFGRERQEHQPCENGDSPDDEEGGGPAPRREARRAIAQEGDCGEEEAGKGHRDRVQPSEGGEERNFQEAQKEEACPCLTRTVTALPSQIRSSRWVCAWWR